MRGPSYKHPNYSSSTEPSFISISRDEYETLLNTAMRYDNLCTNLMSGGVDKPAIDLLSSQSQQSMPQPEPHRNPIASFNVTPSRPRAFAKPSPFEKRASPSKFHLASDNDLPRRRTLNSSSEDTMYSESKCEEMVSSSDSNPYHNDDSQSVINGATPAKKHLYEIEGNRTVQLVDLPERTSHREIVSAVRGGKLLEIHMRPGDKVAAISFVHPSDAAAFLEHSLKWHLYIRKTKVTVRWSNRHYSLSRSAIHRLNLGATRNFAIRHCSSNITPKDIRDDLEHIHNLRVLGVNFKDGDYYVRTNSVSGAYFARTCMISRLKYRKCRFDWLPDECAGPLPTINRKLFDLTTPKKTLNPRANRFEVLPSE